ncbi:hypothetical protein ATCC90586_006999 [Pythium insidiosum]|nr:hypothetical protein ATCC90586_006999 [Pythium insidiosum]
MALKEPSTAAVAPVPPGTGDNQPTAANSPWRPRLLRLGVCSAIICVQSLWAVIIPAKNVVMMPYPQVIPDSLSTSTSSYDRQTELIHSRGHSGHDVYRIVHRVVELALSDLALRRFFEAKGDFVIDDISDFLTPEDHHVLSQYYALVFQASELPAAGFIQRSQQIALWQESTAQWVDATITCSKEESLAGMKCWNPDGQPCDNTDWKLRPRALTLEPVDLHSLAINTGWTNKNSLLSFVSWTHSMMRDVFTKRDWAAVLEANAHFRLLSVADDGQRIRYERGSSFEGSFVYGDLAYGKRLSEWLDLGYRRFESCFSSEYLLSGFFANYFAVRLIHEVLVSENLYGAASLPPTALPIYNFSGAWGDIFAHDVHITSGAGALQFEDVQRTFVGAEMTRFTTSAAAFKLDRPMFGPVLMGSPFRMLLYMKWYPNSYYSYLNVETSGDTLVSDWRQVGGYHAGFNGFKFDFVRNTMAVFRLAERQKQEGTGYDVDWFQQERDLAKWFRRHQEEDPLSLVQLVDDVWQQDVMTDPARGSGCREGLLRKVAQTAWVLALRRHPVLSHLVFMSMADPDEPAAWFKKQMGMNEIVGETITGHRVPFPFSREPMAPVTGSDWVIIPLLKALLLEWTKPQLALLLEWTKPQLVAELMGEMDTTFLDLIEVESGKMMFKDAVHCHYGWATMRVTSTSGKSDVWAKTRARMETMVTAIVDRVDAISEQMRAVADIAVPSEYIKYNRTSDTFPYEGPPVRWRHSALGVGLLKLGVKLAPMDAEVAPLEASMTCYDVLELRYLNVSTRCWAEPKAFQERRERHRSEGLRMLKFSMWSLGVVLNTIGAIVSLKYCARILHLWRHDGLSDLAVMQALKLDIQALGMISIEGVVIMAFSSVPLILVHHLPKDSRFMPDVSQQPTTLVSECLVLLSLTWFVRLGIALGVGVIRLRYFNWWFNILTSRVRYGLLAVVALLRSFFLVHDASYDVGLTKLIASCAMSVVLGFASVVASVVFDRDGPKRCV